jgi:hypothetical protein
MEKTYSAHDITTHVRGERYMLVELHRTLNSWGKTNARVLKALPKPLVTVNDLNVLHAKWLEQMIVDYYYFGSMRTFGNIRTCPAVQIFTELSRTHFILMYPHIVQENEQVAKSGEYTDDLLISFRLELCNFMGEDSNWKTPVMMYTQQDVMNALLMLTEKLDQLPMAAVDELKHVLRVLYTRNSVFLCETSTEQILNVPNMRTAENNMPNRDYLTFCTIYFHAIQRRIFYYEHVQKSDRLPAEVDEAMVERVRLWVADVVDSLGQEGFEDCYAKACEEAYNFPGDREWFKYRYPNLPAQTGPILDCFRKKYAERYYMDYRASKDSVLGVIDQASHSGSAARIFVLNAVDQYMKTQFSIPWRDGLVIDNNALEGNQVKLYRSKAPYLLQVFSRHWVYDKAAVYPCDSLYQSLAIWMYLLKYRYRSTVFGVSLDRLVKKIVDNAQKKSFTAIF